MQQHSTYKVSDEAFSIAAKYLNFVIPRPPVYASSFSSKAHHATRQLKLKLSRQKKILIIDHALPSRNNDAGGRRMSLMLKILKGLGYNILFWSDHDKPQPPEADYLQNLHVDIITPDISFQDFIKLYGPLLDVVVLSRPQVAPKYLELCRTYCPDAKIIYDTVDIVHLRTARQAKIENSPSTKKIAQNLKVLETGIIERVDAAIVVSQDERDVVTNLVRSAKTFIVPTIHPLKITSKSFTERSGLFFIGGFDHQPNVDAMVWFAHKVLPLLHKKLSNPILTIVGSSCPEQVNKLASDHVVVKGYVEDVSELFWQSKLFVAPLRYGAGVKGKIGQAIEYGLPVVTTSIGAEGMHLKHGESCLVADDAKHFADAIVKLYTDEPLWEKLQHQSRKVIHKYFSLEAAEKELVRAFKK